MGEIDRTAYPADCHLPIHDPALRNRSPKRSGSSLATVVALPSRPPVLRRNLPDDLSVAATRTFFSD